MAPQQAKIATGIAPRHATQNEAPDLEPCRSLLSHAGQATARNFHPQNPTPQNAASGSRRFLMHRAGSSVLAAACSPRTEQARIRPRRRMQWLLALRYLSCAQPAQTPGCTPNRAGRLVLRCPHPPVAAL